MTWSICLSSLCAQFFPHSPYTVQFVSGGFFTWLQSPRGPRPPCHWGFEITLRHATFGRTPLEEWSDRRRNLYPTNKTHTHTQHSQETDRYPWWGSNPHSQQALDRAATGILQENSWVLDFSSHVICYALWSSGSEFLSSRLNTQPL
jgi:hypothetical protein